MPLPVALGLKCPRKPACMTAAVHLQQQQQQQPGVAPPPQQLAAPAAAPAAEQGPNDHGCQGGADLAPVGLTAGSSQILQLEHTCGNRLACCSAYVCKGGGSGELGSSRSSPEVPLLRPWAAIWWSRLSAS
ncbi:hypothetical protein ABPG75_010611 [Micractinium tetrahymenae]